MTMCQENFKFTYKPGLNVSMDEGCCPWKGRLRFKVYNPRKPARFHIKTFQISEAESGYIVGFDVYTGKNSCTSDAVCIDPAATTTTKTVVHLADKCGVLDTGRHMFFDNYYSSPELLEELLYRDTLSCGTVRKNRKDLPSAVTQAKLKKGETCFRRSTLEDGSPGRMLALKWCDKREVYMISTMHWAVEKWNKKNDRSPEANPIYKPAVIVDYIEKMGGVDLGDQLLNYYTFLRRSCKWWRKLFIHMLNMVVLNAYILNKKFGNKKLDHSAFREYIAEWLVQCSQAEKETANSHEDEEDFLYVGPDRLSGMHLPMKLEKDGHTGSLSCKVCFIGKKEAKKSGKPQRKRMTSFKCDKCGIAMCVKTCFRAYHKYENFASFL